MTILNGSHFAKVSRFVALFCFIALVSGGCANSESGVNNDSGNSSGSEDGDGTGDGSGTNDGSGSGSGNGSGSHHGGNGPGNNGSGNGSGTGDGDGTGNGDGSGNGSGNGSGSGNGDGSGSGDGNGSGSGGSVCVNGARMCSDTEGVPLLCDGGAWKAEPACTGDLVCLSGACVKGSSCASPLELRIGETLTGSNVGGESTRTGANCGYSLATSEAVIKVTIAETAYYQFDVESTSGGNWSYCAAPVCDSDDMVWALTADWCGGANVKDSFRKLMPKGEFYIFVESKDGNESTFAMTFDRAADQTSYMCYNGDGQIPVSTPTLDLANGTVKLTGQTTVGGTTKQNPMSGSECKGTYSSTKNEAVYPFFLDRPAQINAKITNVTSAVEGKSFDKVLIYIASCKENLGNITINENGANVNECTVSAANADTTEHTSGTLPAGLYNLVVDSTNYNINFDLEVSIVGAE